MKLLIADDEAPARQRLRAMLAEMDDWEVAAEADNGRAAVEQALALDVDAVLLDIAMPVMDGLEAARHLAHLDLAGDPPRVQHGRGRHRQPQVDGHTGSLSPPGKGPGAGPEAAG